MTRFLEDCVVQLEVESRWRVVSKSLDEHWHRKNEKGIRKSRWAIIRNTNPQLRTTTIKTWLDWFPENTWGKFRWEVPYTHFISKGDLELEVIF